MSLIDPIWTVAVNGAAALPQTYRLDGKSVAVPHVIFIDNRCEREQPGPFAQKPRTAVFYMSHPLFLMEAVANLLHRPGICLIEKAPREPQVPVAHIWAGLRVALEGWTMSHPLN